MEKHVGGPPWNLSFFILANFSLEIFWFSRQSLLSWPTWLEGGLNPSRSQLWNYMKFKIPGLDLQSWYMEHDNCRFVMICASWLHPTFIRLSLDFRPFQRVCHVCHVCHVAATSPGHTAPWKFPQLREGAALAQQWPGWQMATLSLGRWFKTSHFYNISISKSISISISKSISIA